ncbi:hypothetical protein T06_9056 [Trichinella sp. T6]|nr:hypothetical protein T06_9056 [Trichinella sp. T6]
MCGYLHLLTQSDNDAMSPRVKLHYKGYDIKKTHISFQTIGLMHELLTAGFISFPIAPIKFATLWKVPRQTNAYVSNKWPVKLPAAYLNTQGSSPSGTSFKRIDNG